MGTSKSVYLQVSQSYLFIMSSTTAPVNTFNKSKEDFIWFVKKAVQDQKSYSYMLEIFTEQDGDKDGIVKLAEFPSMMNQVLVIPQKHGLSVPAQDQFEALFKKYDPRNDGRLTVDEWMSLAKEEVFKKFL